METLNIQGRLIDLREPKVMGILNVTPDSFYSGSRVQDIKDIISRAGEMIEAGATFLDIGGYSSRPGAEHIDAETESSRVIPAIKAIIKEFPACILSIDTFRAEVASKAIEAGAHMVNDISGGHLDENMYAVVGEMGVPYIGMHMRGTPQTMTQQTDYADVVGEILNYFSKMIATLLQSGAKDIIVDPGFGFSKNIDQNYELMKKFESLKLLEKPILVGVSRKSMVYKLLGVGPEQALNGTTVLNTVALLRGASILRVHDVSEAVEVLKLVRRIRN